MSAPLRIAVVGAGQIGLAHVERIRREPTAGLASIVDPAPAARELARGLGVAWFDGIGAMLAADRPDGVVLATPNRLHVAGGLAAIKAGVPVLLEKPVADDLDGALELVEASEKAAVPVLVGHHRRHGPAIVHAREIVRSGRLGRIVAVNGLCWFLKSERYFDIAWRRQPGAGVVLMNLVHMIDDLRNLCGEIVEVQAIGSNAVRGFPVEDTAAVLLRFAGGALGTLSISDTAAAPWSWELTSGEDKDYPQSGESCYQIAGTRGSLSVPRLETWVHPGDGDRMSPIVSERLVAPERDPLTIQMAHFCDVVRGLTPPLVDVREGTRTLEATLAVKRAAETGEVVRLG